MFVSDAKKGNGGLLHGTSYLSPKPNYWGKEKEFGTMKSSPI